MRTLAITCLAGVLALATPARHPAPQSDTRLFAFSFTVGPAWDGSKAPDQQRGWSEHSANMRRLRDSGSILLGGRYGGVGLFIVRAADSTAARALLAPDSATAHGVFQVAIDRWSTVYDGSLPLR